MTLGTLGKYRLVGHLSSGGMADLYRAISVGPEGFRRLVVIKKIRAEFARDPEFLTMFRDEAAIASKLTHSNVAQVYEFDIHEDEPYLVMEFVEGKDLRSILRHCQAAKRPIPYPMALYAAAAVADGLQYIHTRKERGRSLAIVHRDISPQNIMISHSGEVKILDFGVAKADCRNSETQTGVVKGKYGYMSPEQVRCRTIDHRSDIFSLGVVLWEMLTLRRLFASENDILTAQNVCERSVPPPHHIRPELPKELDPILQRALAKDPNERYASAQELRDDISVLLMSAGAYPTPDQVADFVYKLFPQDMESLRQGEHLLEVEEAPQADPTPEPLIQASVTSPTETATRRVQPPVLPDLLPLPSDATGSQDITQPDPTSPLLALPELPESLAPSPAQHHNVRRLATILGLALAVVLLVLVGNTIYRYATRPDFKPPQPVADGQEKAAPEQQPAPVEPARIPQDAKAPVEAPAPSSQVTLTFDVTPADARVFVDGVRHRPGAVTLRKTPGQPLVVEVSAPNHLGEKRMIDAEDGAVHKFHLREKGRLTFVVNPADAIVQVDGQKAEGTRSRFGWVGPAGEAVLVKISRSGMADFEEEVVIPRGDEVRTYKLTSSHSTLISVKTQERDPAPPADIPEPQPPTKPDGPDVAGTFKALLKPGAPKAEPKQEPAPAAKKPAEKSPGSSTQKKVASKAQEPAPKENPSTEEPPQPAAPAAPAAPGVIRVNARPYADIFFRGKAWGRTPKDIDVEPGSHEVILKFPTATHTCKVEVVSGKTATCFFDFDPVESGSPEPQNDQKNP